MRRSKCHMYFNVLRLRRCYYFTLLSLQATRP